MNIEQLKTKVKRIDFCMPSNEFTITQDIKELLDVVVQLDAQERLDDAYFESQWPKSPARAYLTGEFLFFLSKYLIEFKQFQAEENQKNANMILELTVGLCLKLLRENPDQMKLYETLRFILDPERFYYRYKGQAEPRSSRFAPELELTEDQILFVEKLKTGDPVDALKADPKGHVIGWSRATIVAADQQSVTVSWVGEGTQSDRIIDRFSWDLAPFKSYTPDDAWDWRFLIKQGDIVDCPDDNVWYNATVIRIYPDGRLRIGFRHYDERGLMQDEMGKFWGWSSQYDEDVHPFSPKIQRPNTFSKAFCKYASLSNAEESIQDHNDFVYNLGRNKMIYAVPRLNTRHQRKSLVMAHLIQVFGERGGFELFFERITTQWCPIETLHIIMAILGQMHEMLHRQFVYAYVPRVLESVTRNLLNSPDSNLRNYSYQRISETLQGLGNICKRTISLKEKNELVDKLDMDIAMRCFKSEFLERQIHGLKAIQDLIRRTKESQVTMANSDLKYLNVQLIVDWVNENRVFESIYTSQNNSYIVQRSSDFLKFMLDEKLVSMQQLEMIVKSAKKGEIEDKQAIYKILKDVSQSFSKEQLIFIIQTISGGRPQQLVKEDLDLLQDITKFNYRFKDDFNNLFLAFYWSILQHGDLVHPDIQELTVTQYVEVPPSIIHYQLINSFDYRPLREQHLRQIGAQVQEDKQVPLMLRILTRFIDKLELQPLSWDQFTRDAALTQLQTENNIIDSVFTSIRNFKAHPIEPYLDGIRVRTDFIQFFYSNIQNRDLALDFATVGRLWDELVEQAKVPQERDILYRWFGSSTLKRGVEIEELVRFFDERMTKNLPALTEEGFICLQSLVTTINLNRRTFSQAKREEDEYLVQGLLADIFGFATIQEIIWYSDDSVSKLARQFMINLVQNHAEPQVALREYIEYSFAQLGRVESVARTLLLLQDLLGESESLGVGNLRSIGALSVGEPAQIECVNQSTQGWQVQRRFTLTISENATVFDLRIAITHKIKAAWDSFNMSTSQGQLSLNDNGRVVRDLRIKRGDQLTITKRQTAPIPEDLLVDKANELTPDAKRVFKELFDEFSTDGLMNKEQCARYVSACTGNTCLPDDHQIARTFEQYDKDKDGFLRDENFIEFYHEASKSKASTVWLNLHMMNYRNDLLRGDFVKPPTVVPTQLPRYILSRSEQQMAVLFKLLDQPSRDEAWKLLRRLPPSPSLVMRLLTLEEKEILPASEYRLLYHLYIIEYLMDVSSDLDLLLEGAPVKLQAQQLQFYRQNWTLQFVEHGGFQLFLQTFTQYNRPTEDALHKLILSFLLKILANFLSAVYHPTTPFLYQTMKLAQSRTLDVAELKQFTEVPAEFQALVNSLQLVADKAVLQESLYTQLLEMVRGLLQHDLEAEDRQILEYAMNVIVCIILHDTELLKREFAGEQLLRTLLEGLLTNKGASLRGLFAKQAFLIVYQSQTHLKQSQPTQRLFDQLVQQLPACSLPQNAACSESYYELLSVLVETQQSQFVSYTDLAETLIHTLQQHESLESVHRVGPDQLIIGLLTLLSRIVLHQDVRDTVAAQKNLVQVVFNECLFAFGNNKNVKCKSRESRQAAFKLLRALCSESPANTQIMMKQCLGPLAQQVPPIGSWNHVPGNDQRQNGYLGIRNLGCICYMIAMLQQFFLTPTFRYAILMAEDGQEPNMQPRPKDGVLADDNVFHQFQRMFASLELSDRVDYNPTDFCFAFKDFTGTPVDVTVQQDSQEFLNMILERLENALKPTPFRTILESVFGGKTVTQLTCAQCKYVRNKEETFFNLSLPIKNQKTLSECFEKFISGEVISDYRCDGCEKKVDVTKRQMLLQMPNVLILHLQRIVFNLDTLANEKINSRVEFPTELNLSQYLVDHKQQEENSQYKLVGVVVHFGAAEFGHYFSYIDIQRDRDSKESKWFEFNDSKVKDFKPSNIENECFGGASTNTDNEDFGWWKSNRENSQNAYILVYEKTEKTPIKIECNDQAHLDAVQQQFNLQFISQTAREDGKIEASIDYYGLPRYVPENLASVVQRENQQFQLERSLYDSEFFGFLNEVCKCYELPDVDLKQPFYSKWEQIPESHQLVNQQLLLTLIPYNFDLLARAYDNRLLEPLVERMRYLLHISPNFAFEFLERFFFQRGAKTIELLLCCPESNTRELVSKVLAQTFNEVIAFHQLALDEPELPVQRDKSLAPTRQAIDNAVTKSLSMILDLLKDQVPKNWVRFDQYFQFWRDLVDGGEVQLQFLQRRKVVTLFLDFMLEGNSPVKISEKKHTMGNPYYQPNFSTLFEVCLKFIKRCQTNPDEEFKLSYVDRVMLFSSRLIEKLLRSIKKQPLIAHYFVQMCFEDQLYSEIVCSCVLRSINTFSQDEYIPLAGLVVQLLEIEDSLQQLRIEWILGYPSCEPKQTKGAPSDVLPQFGMYGFTGLDEDVYKYPSPLHYHTSFLDMIAQNVCSIKRSENHGIITIAALAQAMVKLPAVRNYVLRLPAINYTLPTFASCFAPFVEYYQQESKRYYFSNFPTQEAIEECLKWLTPLQPLIQPSHLTPHPSYIMGSTLSADTEKILYYLLDGTLTATSQNKDPQLYDQIYYDTQIEKLCIVQERTYEMASCPNKPTGRGNDAFPDTFVKGTILYNYQVLKGSQAAHFLEYRPTSWASSNMNPQYYDYNNFRPNQGDQQTFVDAEEPSPQAQAQAPQTIDDYVEVECVRTIQITNLKSKSVHFVVKFKSADNTIVPTSGLQKIVKPNSQLMFATLCKQNRDLPWGPADYELSYNILEGFGDALFVTKLTAEERMLFVYR